MTAQLNINKIALPIRIPPLSLPDKKNGEADNSTSPDDWFHWYNM